LYIGRQDKLRYIIEIIPPLSIIAGIGIDAFVKTYVHKLKHRLLLLALFVGYLTLPLWKLTPYYLEYFNELVGGTSTVYHQRLFQMGGGGPGLKAAGIFVEKHATKGESVGIAADPGRNIKHGDGLQFSEYDNEKEYDWVVVNYYLVIRSGFDEEPVKRKYALVHTVYAGGAELVHVYTRK
jgi:hypothetical protein